jgi:hypothetical protein
MLVVHCDCSFVVVHRSFAHIALVTAPHLAGNEAQLFSSRHATVAAGWPILLPDLRQDLMGEYVTWTFSPNNNGIAHRGQAG